MKNAVRKFLQIALNSVPIILMIALIPVIRDDFVLTGAYISIIAVSFLAKYRHREIIFFVFGFVVMTISEYFFISIGVETFSRTTLFGKMPLWLPFIWAYAFVAIERAIHIIETQ